MTDQKKGTLSIGGTLSVSNTPARSNPGVAVEVRRRRFNEPAAAPAAGTANTGDAELQRRLETLQRAQAQSEAEQKRREEERAQAAKLQNLRAQEAEDARKKREEEEAERKRREEEANKPKTVSSGVMGGESAPGRTVSSRDFSRKTGATPAVGDAASRGPRPAANKEADKKRGRNAYLEELEQRYRAMPGRKREKSQSRVAADGSIAQTGEKLAREVTVPDFITVGELASRMAEKSGDVVKKLMLMGEMVTVNQTIDQETAQLIVEEFGHTAKLVSESEVEEQLSIDEADAPESLQPRPPVVTVMGHVDHGKTTLLDAMRKSNVVAGEAGGITQHIGAYQVVTPKSNRRITFLDTPGHAAFTAMRARGADVTDVVILVVAADDGIMPQTIEAIQHARAAKKPIVVAINKMDKPDADASRVKNELLSHDVILEDFGGEVPAVPVSALKGQGLTELEEIVLLQADMLDLKANPGRRANGVVVEARLDKGRGPVATVVVQGGTLRVGDIVVAGKVWGRVRALLNDRGENVQEAPPSSPVEILGLQGVPAAGDAVTVAQDEKQAKEVADYRERKAREAAQAARKLSLDTLFDRMAAEGRVTLNLIVKGDVQGSVEAIKGSLTQLNTAEVEVAIIQSGVGVITESDVNLAITSGAIIMGFNVRADASARPLAEREGVEIRYYSIIYELIDDVKAAMTGLLAPAYEEVVTGQAEVRQIFTFGKLRIAGCMVTEGKLVRNAAVRVLRDGVVAHTGSIASLRREKDDVREVNNGYECGVTLTNFADVKEGDVLEVFEKREIKRTLDDLKKAESAKEKAAKSA